MTLLLWSLEKWREGYEPCTDDGRPVRQLTLLECNDSYPIVGVVQGVATEYKAEWNIAGSPNHPAWGYLRLRAKTTKMWVIVFFDPFLKEYAPKLFSKEPMEESWELGRAEIDVLPFNKTPP